MLLPQSVLTAPSCSEDDCIKDLRRVLLQEIEPDCWARCVSAPSPTAEVLHPELGRCSDVNQPGGFRRHHVCQQVGATVGTYARVALKQMLLPQIAFPEILQGAQEDATVQANAGAPPASNATVAILFTKLFLSAAFLFVPKGFQSAGLIGGPVVLLLMYLLELYGMRSLIRCHIVAGGGQRFDELAQALGPWGQPITRGLIALSQFGFSCVWILYTAQNLQMVLPWMTDRQRLWLPFPVLVPLVWVRRLDFFTVTNLVGIVVVLVTAVYLLAFSAQRLYHEGAQPVRTMNTGITMWMGSCAYVYQDANFVIPAFESAQDKEMVPAIITLTSFAATVLFVLFGLLFYMAFGDDVASLATLNLPLDSWAGSTFPSLFVISGVFTLPLDLLLIFQMYEPQIAWSKSSLIRKWQTNASRVAVLFLTMLITDFGGQSLQHWLGVIGGVCCATIALMLPAALNIAICKPNKLWLVIDVVTFAAGTFVMIVSTEQALASWG